MHAIIIIGLRDAITLNSYERCRAIPLLLLVYRPGMIATGIIMVGFGELLYAVRVIAINSEKLGLLSSICFELQQVFSATLFSSLQRTVRWGFAPGGLTLGCDPLLLGVCRGG